MSFYHEFVLPKKASGFSDKDKAIKGLKKTISNLKAQIEQIKQHPSQNPQTTPSPNTPVSSNPSTVTLPVLQSNNVSVGALNKQLTDTQNELLKLINEKNTLEKERNTMELEKINVEQEKNAISKELQSKIQNYKDETVKTTKLKDEIKRYKAKQTSINSTERPTLKQNKQQKALNTKIENYFTKLEQTILDLNSRLSTAENQNSPNADQTKIQEELKRKTEEFELLKKEQDILTKKQANLEKTNQKLAATSLKYKDQQTSIDSLNKRLDTVTDENVKIKNQLTDATLKYERLEVEKNNAVGDFNSLSAELIKNAQTIQGLTHENQRLHENEDQYVEVDGVKEDGFDNEE